MDADRIDDLSSEARIEITEYYLLVDTKRRDFRDSGRSDRRKPGHWLQPWPQSQPWTVHGEPAAARPAWTSSYIARQTPQWRVARGFLSEVASERPQRAPRTHTRRPMLVNARHESAAE